MSTEEENPTPDPQGEEPTPKAPRKKAAKKAVKKRARKTAAPAEEFVPGPVESGSSDDEVTFSADIVVDDEDSPKKEAPKPAENNESRPRKEAHQQGQQDRSKGNKFKHNKNNNKRGKQRGKNKPWQNKNKQRDREEETPIEFGELLDWEVLEKLETIQALAVELKSGGGEALDYNSIYDMGLTELRGEAAAREVETSHHAPNRDQLINAIVKQSAEAKSAIYTTGILELLDDEEGGLLVYERDSYRIKSLSAYVPQVFIEHYGLKRGHIVEAQLHPHREGESCPFVVAVRR